eukprot:2928314-Ditylum_brightwellii.AAC.1
MASEADFGGTSVGSQWLIIDFLCGGGLEVGCCSFGGFSSHGNGICQQPHTVFCPMLWRRREVEANIAGIMGIVVEEGVFDPYCFQSKS